MVHAVRYYEFFEDAFLDWLGERGGYDRLRREGADLVIRASGCEHHAPARLGDVPAVQSAPSRVGTTSLSIRSSRGDRRLQATVPSGAGGPSRPERAVTEPRKLSPPPDTIAFVLSGIGQGLAVVSRASGARSRSLQGAEESRRSRSAETRASWWPSARSRTCACATAARPRCPRC
ncbi:hotdog domain-containing protein [Nonomuraea maritima]|uniref:acyl-CoA thioesterase n=1 Tax=Nonomuraea maritima TaxID=683260 RepID=UPI003CCC1E6A